MKGLRIPLTPKNVMKLIQIVLPFNFILFIFSLAKDKGSFSKLRGGIQRLAVELLFHLPSLDDQLLANVVSCCHGEQVDVAVIQYLLQVLLYRFVNMGQNFFDF